MFKKKGLDNSFFLIFLIELKFTIYVTDGQKLRNFGGNNEM